MGMGIASRAGKLDMHSNISPIVKEGICVSCQDCIENCNAKAIKIFPATGKAKIDPEKCEGCALCIAICPQGAISVPWHGTTKELLQKKIVDYAQGIMKLFLDKIIYINVLEKITEQCDCMGFNQNPIMPDIGILMGEDPVAVDNASFDLVEKSSDGKFSETANADKTQINYAAKKGLGSKEYEIIDVDEIEYKK